MNVAVFGGSFNPPHLGHVLVTQYVLSRFNHMEDSQSSNDSIDQVWWVPCVKHAFGKQLTDFESRVSLCKLAIDTLPRNRVLVSTIEKDISSDGRMYHVLTALKQEHPGKKFKLLVGEDILNETQKWFRFKQIKNEFGVMVVPRGGKDGIISITSTSVRDAIAKNEAIDNLVPRRVARKIAQWKLYESS